MDRKTFLSRLSLGLSGLIATLIAIPVIGTLIAPLVMNEPRKWRDVGSVDKFEQGSIGLVEFKGAGYKPWSGKAAKQAAWVKRESASKFIAFSVNCTHLGCPVRWQKDAEMFFCPCHGGVFYDDGTVAGGPPPRELQRYPIRVKNGRVQVLTSPVPITNITA
ncbi:MAG TPA: ubiquinol-cytochrome c reductase iron-sulfur subunit [Fodinibius sp.]|nr:ubiquinol-cytochrome c reductase iron-sulfur subunit [Fodinibius sp.]